MNQTPMPPKKTNRWLRRLLAALAVLVVTLLAYTGYTIYNVNFHTIVNGEAYRSGQMDAAQFTHVIQDHGIKSIINLRGTNATALYQGEIETANRLGVQHYDFSLSAIEEVTLSQMDEIIRTLREAPKPVLIHCKAGSDRTGLASALYCLVVKGESPAEADRELSVWYGHIPLTKTIAMDHSFWHYVSNHVAHAGLKSSFAPAAP
jgi:protein tyrosine/serine phosphatase